MRLARISIGFGLVAAIGFTASLPVHGQSATSQPRIGAGDMHYLGSFEVPSGDGSGTTDGRLTYGGAALGIGPRGLYIGGHVQNHPQRLLEISIPAIGGRASVLQRAADPTGGRQGQIDSGDNPRLAGSLLWNERLITSYFSYYDGDTSATLSHVASSPVFSTSPASGPVAVGTAGAGFVGGYMTTIPSEWQGLFGAPALTGQCCLAIIERSSLGPSVSAFDPDDIGRVSPVPARLLVGYPIDHPTLGEWRSNSRLYNGTTEVVGVAFPPGTRSVLFFGRQGMGTFCYGGDECNDPAGSYQGVHAYPYVHMVWAYDANDLLAVRQGALRPWDVRPYATWQLSDMNRDGSASMRGATYDPRTRRLYVTESYGERPRVHVYEISAASAEDPSTTPPHAPPAGPVPEVCGDGVDNDFDGSADESCPGSGLGALLAPLAPVNLVRTLVGRVATFGWLAPIAGDPPTGYVADVGLAPGQTVYRFAVGSLTSARVPNVPNGKYYVRLRAYNHAGFGPASNEVVVNANCTAAPHEPTWLSALTNGSVVSLTWMDRDGCADTYYRMSVGSTPGAANLAAIPTNIGSLIAAAGPGTYYTRVQAVSRLGVSAPSAERRVDVRSSTCTPPTFATSLRGTTAGGLVTLSWDPIQTSTALASDRVVPVWYNLEVGSTPGRADLAVYQMGRTTRFSTVAPPGRYYVRIRAMNMCGPGVASNDFFVAVN